MAVTFTLNAQGSIDFIDVRQNQPVRETGANGQLQQIPGITQDITLKYTMAPNDIKLELINLSKQRTTIVNQQMAQLALIDGRVSDLNNALALINA